MNFYENLHCSQYATAEHDHFEEGDMYAIAAHCTGNEDMLAECPSGLLAHPCYHESAVQLSCGSS